MLYCEAGAKRAILVYSSYIDLRFLYQTSTHKGAHNHDITMMKYKKFIKPNAAGAIRVLGIAVIVL